MCMPPNVNEASTKNKQSKESRSEVTNFSGLILPVCKISGRFAKIKSNLQSSLGFKEFGGPISLLPRPGNTVPFEKMLQQ